MSRSGRLKARQRREMEKKEFPAYIEDERLNRMVGSEARLYINRKEGKSEIHDYGDGVYFISKDSHGCTMDEGWIPSYTKKDGTVVRGHCRNMNNGKPLNTYEIHAMYEPSEWKEVEALNRKIRKDYREKKRRQR